MVPNAQKLMDLLARGGPGADAIKQFLDHTQISRITRGIRGPSLQTAIDLARITGGALPVEGWAEVVEATGTDGEA